MSGRKMPGSKWPAIPTCSLSNNKTHTWQSKHKSHQQTSSPRLENSSKKAKCRRPCSAQRLKYRKMNKIMRLGNFWANSTKSQIRTIKPFWPSNKHMKKIHTIWIVCQPLESVSPTSSLKKMPLNICTHGSNTTQTSKRLQMLREKAAWTSWISRMLSWLLTSRTRKMQMSSQLWEPLCSCSVILLRLRYTLQQPLGKSL